MTAIFDLPDSEVFVTDNGINVEWHDHGMNIEVRFRESGIYAVIEDAKHPNDHWSGMGVDAWRRVKAALKILAARNGE